MYSMSCLEFCNFTKNVSVLQFHVHSDCSPIAHGFLHAWVLDYKIAQMPSLIFIYLSFYDIFFLPVFLNCKSVAYYSLIICSSESMLFTSNYKLFRPCRSCEIHVARYRINSACLTSQRGPRTKKKETCEVKKREEAKLQELSQPNDHGFISSWSHAYTISQGSLQQDI